MLPLIEAINQKRLVAEIAIVVSNKADAGILEKARLHQLMAKHVDATGLSREDYDDQVSQALLAQQVDLIVLIGYMRILSADFVTVWQGKIINTHPSLLPAFAGKMDLAVHEEVLAAGVTKTGCTVHYVTEEVDAGPIILQKSCSVLENDTPQSLKERVQALESQALIEAIALKTHIF